MVKINVKRDESIEQALRRFNKEVAKEGIIEELRRRQFYERPSQARKREVQVKLRASKKGYEPPTPEVRPEQRDRRDS